ncbi:MAG: type II secretion system F family protein [Candidatus Heimdallarchaeota archaeon]
MKIKLNLEKKILIASISISAFVILLGIITQNAGILGNGIILSIFIVFVPLILFRYEKIRILREYEERFPTFLRDVIESMRSGMPLHQAIITCSKFDYGRLAKEVKKMANQISWGLPVDKVLDQFTERVKKSNRLYLALKTLRESYLTGGDIESTLESIADNLVMMEDADKEKRSLMNQYVLLMYAIAFIFLGILVAINKLMVPIFSTTSTGGMGFGFVNPCEVSSNPICSLYTFPSVYIFAIKDITSIGAYYVSIFFYMSIIVAISCGLIVGQISENSLTAGLKHSAIMTGAVIGIMLILKTAGFLGV